MQATLISGQISASHARALVSIDDPEARETLFKRILDENLPVRDTEQAVREHKIKVKGHTRTKSGQSKPPEVKAIEDDLQKTLARKVELQLAPGKTQKGVLKLEFYSLDDLDHLINQLKRVTS
jgi:ParB family chromosome partitioning protein